MEVLYIPMIAAAVFLVVEVFKAATSKSARRETFMCLIPVIAAVLGAAFGIVCFYAFPEMFSADSLLTAVLTGAASGLTATGCSQIFKQLQKFGVKVDAKITIEEK